MLFSSLVFLFVFLPILLAIYFLSPGKYRNYVLLLFSFLFYAWGGISYSLILVFSVVVNYFFVRRLKSSDKKKNWLIVGLTVNITLIAVFKYLDFILENLNVAATWFSNDFAPFPLPGIALPLGISFFTFQQMSLLWDVYRDDDSRKISFANTALYISLFPQLIAGPIVRYNDIIDQIKSRVVTIDLFRSGVQRFVFGLFKKIVIANACGELADSIINSPLDNLSAPVAWLGIVCYAFQIYFDFSGYSDMAIGLGRMFGFRILENFNFPYISRSIQEFWRRWHISLSMWFRDYVYIPLGGNRSGSQRTYFNLFIVFLLTGLWHGATWSFVLWGLFHGLFLILEKTGLDKILKRLPPLISWAYVMVVVLIGWVLFRIEDLPDAVGYIGKLFGYDSNPADRLISYYDRERFLILGLATVLSTPIFRTLKSKAKLRFGYSSLSLKLLSDFALIAMFVYSVMCINSGSYNPFIYFRF
jgi:alginate O-acetyltransferase complex protein AlgI